MPAKRLTKIQLVKTEYFDEVKGLEWELWRGVDLHGRQVMCWIPAWIPAELARAAIEAFPDDVPVQTQWLESFGMEVKPRRVLRGNKVKRGN